MKSSRHVKFSLRTALHSEKKPFRAKHAARVSTERKKEKTAVDEILMRYLLNNLGEPVGADPTTWCINVTGCTAKQILKGTAPSLSWFKLLFGGN